MVHRLLPHVRCWNRRVPLVRGRELYGGILGGRGGRVTAGDGVEMDEGDDQRVHEERDTVAGMISKE